MSESQSIKEFYDKQYVRDTNIAHIPSANDFMYAQVLSQILPYLKPGIKVLDLGCNNGNLSLFMARAGCDVLGIDLADNAIEAAIHSAEHYKIGNVQFKCMDFLNEWDTPEYFDFVVCSHVIEHVPNDHEFMDKIFYAMKHNANLVLLTPSEYSSLVYVTKLFTGRFVHDEEVGHLRRYTNDTLIDIANRAGLLVTTKAFLDGPLRDWIILFKPLRKLVKIFSLPYIRRCFNAADSVLARLTFSATICLHCKKV